MRRMAFVFSILNLISAIFYWIFGIVRHFCLYIRTPTASNRELLEFYKAAVTLIEPWIFVRSHLWLWILRIPRDWILSIVNLLSMSFHVSFLLISWNSIPYLIHSKSANSNLSFVLRSASTKSTNIHWIIPKFSSTYRRRRSHLHSIIVLWVSVCVLFAFNDAHH